MQIVIDIPEDTYTHLCNGGNIGASLLIENAIKNGTPLHKGHGDLVDIDKVLEEMIATRTYDIPFALERVKPIIEADKESEVENMVTREQYETLSKNYLELKEKYANLKENAIIIPENATNGDMIKAMFSNARVDDTSEKFGQLSICTHDAKSVFSSDWWNAPYKGGKEE